MSENKRRIEKQQHQYRCWLETLLRSILDAVIATDLEGRIQLMNPPAQALTGWSANEAVGLPVAQVFQLKNSDHALIPLLQQGESLNLDKTHTLIARDQREVPVEGSLAPIKNDQGQVYGSVWILRDVTERRLLEEQLRQFQKMEAIGRFAGGIAHDFNNMLTIINGYSNLVLSKLESDSPLRKAIEEIHKAGQRSAALTKQLLAFGRKQLLNPTDTDLSACLREIEGFLQQLLGEEIHLILTLEPDLGHVIVDRSQLEQVIMNLAINARDAMAAGGNLLIQTGNVPLSRPLPTAAFVIPPGDYVSLVIRDTGTGIPDEVLPHIFEPFFTTKEKGKGTGLGLSTAYGIIQQSGGYLWLESRIGAGTTFYIYLPRTDQPLQPGVNSLALTEPGGKEPPTILVVEDEQEVRSLICEVLQAKGYHILEAGHGKAALEIYHASPTPIDLIVTDVEMPEMTGSELVRCLAAEGRDIKVLFISGYTNGANLKPSLGTEAAFLAKPFTPDSLIHKVRETLAQ